jgi:hypothetical protein
MKNAETSRKGSFGFHQKLDYVMFLDFKKVRERVIKCCGGNSCLNVKKKFKKDLLVNISSKQQV